MRRGVSYWIVVAVLSLSSALGQSVQPGETPPAEGDASKPAEPAAKVPENTIIVKGAWSSASDATTPVPEGAKFDHGVFDDPYFGMKYSLPAGWTKGYDGPPPSDSGRYVLAQIRFQDPKDQTSRGSMLITADDLFFTLMPVDDALEFVGYMKDHLQSGYQLERKPTSTEIAGHPFTFFSYWSPVAELHWYVAATEIRCHAVAISLLSRDTRVLENGLLDLNKMTLPDRAGPRGGTGGESVPVCIKDYARPENIVTRVDPVFSEHRGNPVPVRIIIGKDGKVTHIHFLAAFPGQAKAITDALFAWRFKPYLEKGQPVEVETGILFGRPPGPAMTSPAARAKVDRQ